MKTIEELLAIKMTIKTLSVKVKRIENVNKMLKKKIAGSGEISGSESRVSESNVNKSISYLDRFQNENKTGNAFNPD
ncbi:MAG TPA: hypothetical protein PKD83_08955 [Ignavibacteria bacterium]|nr:hypothetical protein [Ignavibacteria bacterium]